MTKLKGYITVSVDRLKDLETLNKNLNTECIKKQENINNLLKELRIQKEAKEELSDLLVEMSREIKALKSEIKILKEGDANNEKGTTRRAKFN